MSCKPCLGKLIKDTLSEKLPGLADVLEEIPTCEEDANIELCMNEPREATKGSGRKKRAPSAYNRYTGSCMKEGNSMKECASRWKTQKG